MQLAQSLGECQGAATIATPQTETSNGIKSATNEIKRTKEAQFVSCTCMKNGNFSAKWACILALPALTGAMSCGGSDKTDAPATTAPDTTCSALKVPASLELGEGRSQRIALPSGTDTSSFRVDGQGGADGWIESKEGNASLVLRAGYGDEAATVKLNCGANGSTTVAITRKKIVWTKLSEWKGGTDGPLGREYFTFWQDQGNPNRLFVFTGFHYVPKQYTPSNDLWSFELATKQWTELKPTGTMPTVAGSRLAPLANERGALFFGGSLATSDGSLNTPPLLKKLKYDDSSFSIEDAPNASKAPGSYTGSFVYDAKRSRYLSICGADMRGALSRGINCDMDAYTEAAGFSVVPTELNEEMNSRFGFHYALDTVNDRFVVFGGQYGNENLAISADTWALELSETTPRWVRLFEQDDSAMKRRNGAYVHDTDSNRMFVWGGTPNGSKSVKGIQVLSLDRGHEVWTSLELPNGPHERTSGMALYDSVGKRLIMGFGNDDRVYTDLWQLSLP